ncbi:MAG: 23S rRNA (uracil(1939)-C(5))-methyltransferase RlmD [Spirochaetales bacterium]|nr:23S rRNA (uracil(1939)-C(5))-methyltransferase RlmD [Spirochaetales bacterium]
MGKRDKEFDNCEVVHVLAGGDMLAQDDKGTKITVDGRQTVPGDRIRVTAGFRKRKGTYEGRNIDVLTPSADRIQPFCSHFGPCGGCRWQLVPYSLQVQWKGDLFLKALKATLPGEVLESTQILPPLQSPQDRVYRNKMEYSFSNRRWRLASEMEIDDPNTQAAGLFVPGTPGKVLDLETCYLQDDRGNTIRNGLKKFAQGLGISFYDSRANTGYLRTLVIRTTGSGELMVVLIVAYEDFQLEQQLVDYLRTTFPFVTSLYTLVNSKLNDSYADLKPQLRAGSPWITETLEGLEFHVGPLSFFQTNIFQTPQLYALVRQWADIRPTDVVYDLYTGTGTIAAYLARHGAKVIGVEYIEEAVEAARRSCAENGLKNTEFFAGDMKDVLNREFFSLHGRPDVLVCDPPRPGIAEPVLHRILEAEPRRIIYVSCNPTSLARDLSILVSKYQLVRAQAVDMAPHTPHVEAVVQLDRKVLAAVDDLGNEVFKEARLVEKI